MSGPHDHPAAVPHLTAAHDRTTAPKGYRPALRGHLARPPQRLACLPPGRAALRATAHTWGVTAPALDDLLSIATELLTNAIQHASPGQIHATLRLAPTGDRVRIEVTDTGRRLPRPAADC